MSTSLSTEQDSPSAAPSVVAIVVTHNPGPWFEETLAALSAQDYPRLAILVLDAASAVDPLPRVARMLPSAFVRRLSRNPGFAAACNRATRIVHGASHLVFCHDDVAPAPDAISKMMERAYRSNAGVVTPKMVDWDDPNAMIALGGSVDSTGAFVSNIEYGDRDQGQYDQAEEVFVAPGGFMLTRADLFLSLGGFDGAMTFTGEDVDYSWRVQLAGARIVTEPTATVRHLEAASNDLRLLGSSADLAGRESGASASANGEEDGPESELPMLDILLLSRRHRLRMLLKVRGRLEVWKTAAKLAVLSVGESVGGIISGHGEHTAAVSSSWIWNAAHWRDLVKLRRHAQKQRVVSEEEIDKHLLSARSRFSKMVRDDLERRREQFLEETSGGNFVGHFRRMPLYAWIVIVAIWLVGTRHLWDGPLPSIGTIVPFETSPIDSFQRFLGMLPTEPFGVVQTISPIHLVFGLASMLLLGSATAMSLVLVLGCLPLGVWGMARLTSPLRSPRGQLAAILAYVAAPIPYDALAVGRWGALVGYALAPFILARMLRALDTPPFRRARRHFDVDSLRKRQDDVDDLEAMGVNTGDGTEATLAGVGTAGSSDLSQLRTVERSRNTYVRAERVLPLALVLGFGAMIVPQLLVAVVAIAVVLSIGTLLSKDKSADRIRVIILTTVASLLAALLLTPMFLGSDLGYWQLLKAPRQSIGPQSFAEVLGLSLGVTSLSWFTLGLYVAGLPALIFGREWRYHLSVRLWLLALACVGVQWVGMYTTLIDPNPAVWLSFAAACLAANVAVGVVAVQRDLPAFRFGWRQALPIMATLGVIVALFPVMGRVGTGTFRMPQASSVQVLDWMDAETPKGAYRVLWLGSGDALPGGGRHVDVDLAMSLTDNTMRPEMPIENTKGGKGQEAVVDALRYARQGSTVELGHRLSPYSIRYLVMPTRTAPPGTTGVPLRTPEGLVEAFDEQLDLRRVPSDSSIVIYENLQYLPIRAKLSDTAVLGSHASQDRMVGSETTGTLAELQRTSSVSWVGNMGGTLYLSQERSSAWKVTANGAVVQPEVGFDWASTYDIGPESRVEVRYSPPEWLLAIQVICAVVWLFVLLVALRHFSTNGRWS